MLAQGRNEKEANPEIEVLVAEMIRYVYNSDGLILLHTEEATPICGEDYCEMCGDCLVCAIAEPCFYNAEGNHLWVRYEETEDNIKNRG